jgi:hypothetical protein
VPGHDSYLSYQFTDHDTGIWLYERGGPAAYEAALREALPALYTSIRS